MSETVTVDSSRRGSLPPLVEGKLNGYLIVKVDEIKWHHTTPGPAVNVTLQWWGGSVATFLPRDSHDQSLVPFKEMMYVYDILTNVTLFECYLKDCETLNFKVLDNQSKTLLGSGKIENIHLLISQNTFQSYYPAFNVSGTIIADVRVCFNLKLFPCAYKTVKDFLVPSSVPGKGDETDTVNSKKLYTDQLPRHCNSPVSVCREQVKNQERDENDLVTGALLQQNSDFISNDSILKMLEKSHNIRETSVGSKGLESKFNASRSSDANVVDYLLGKEMNEERKASALKTIRDTSPVSSLLELVAKKNSDANKETVQSICEVNKKKKKTGPVSDFQMTEQSKGPYLKHFKEIKNSVKKHDVKSERDFDAHSAKEVVLAKHGRYMRITVQTLSLNYVGMQRVVTSSNNATCRPHKQISQLPPGVTYFVEYEIPHSLTCQDSRNLKDARLRPWSSKIHRSCSKQRIGKCINFFQNTIHMLASNKLGFVDQLCSAYITFRVYCRYLNQRLPALVGEAILSLAEVVDSRTLSQLQQLSILPQRCAPRHSLSLGTLKVKVELGSSRTCFGQDVLQSAFNSFSSSSESESESEEELKESNILKDRNLPFCKPKQQHHSSSKSSILEDRHSKDLKHSGFKADKKKSTEKILLLGMLHISEGRGFENASTYLVCHAFWKDDIMTSDICWDTDTPYYSFHQLMPVILSLDLLDRCYNNFLVTEVWSHNDLLGIAKLPLNQFYIAYRDSLVVNELILSKYPIIAVDGWVNVIDPLTSRPIGQLNAVLAMGTEYQIQMLEMTRGLKDSICQPPLPPALAVRMEKRLLSSFQTWRKEHITEYGTSNIRTNPKSQSNENKYEEEINERTSPVFDLELNSQSSSNLFNNSIIPPISLSESNPDYGSKVKSYKSQRPAMSLENAEKERCVLKKKQVSERSMEPRYLDDEEKDSMSYLQCDSLLLNKTSKQDTISLCVNLEEEFGNNLSNNSSHQKAVDLLDLAEELNKECANTKLQYAQELESCFNEIESSQEPTQSEKLPDSGKTPIQLKSYNSLQSDIAALLVLNNTAEKEAVICAPNSESVRQLREDDSAEGDKSTVVQTEDVATQTDSQIYEIFHARVEIVCAIHLTKLESGIPPDCYVTLQTAMNNMIITPVVARSTCPVWNWNCETFLPASLLENDEKRLILKVWHKKDSVSKNPNPIQDLVIGFAALDLSLLLFGLPWVSGWFNISDFSGHCRGQIRVCVAPLENLSRFKRTSAVVPTNKRKITVDKAEKNYNSVLTDSAIGEMLNTLIQQCTKTVSVSSDQPIKRQTKCCSAQTDDIFANFIVCENSENIRGVNTEVPEKSFNSNSNLLGVVTGPTTQFCHSTSGVKDNHLHFENRESSILTNTFNVNRNKEMASELANDVSSSFLSKTLQQKLSELDEITKKIKDRLDPSERHVALTFPSNPWMGEEALSSVARNCSAVERGHLPSSQANENENCKGDALHKKTTGAILGKTLEETHGEKSNGKQGQLSVPSPSVSLPLHSDHIHDRVARSGICSNFGQFLPSNERLIESSEADSEHLNNKKSGGDELFHTDDLMQRVLRGMDLENIFNPLLFQHILNCQNNAQNTSQHSFPYANTQSCETTTKQMPDNLANAAMIDSYKNFDIPNSLVSCNITEGQAELEPGLDGNLDNVYAEIMQEMPDSPLLKCDDCSGTSPDVNHDQSPQITRYQENRTEKSVNSNAIPQGPSIDTAQELASSNPHKCVHNRTYELIRSNPSGVSTEGGDLETAEEIVKRQNLCLSTTSGKSQCQDVASVRNILSKLNETNTSSADSSEASLVIVRRQAPDGGNPLEEKQKKSLRLHSSVAEHHFPFTNEASDKV